MSPIPAGDEEYVAIGKVITGTVKIQGGRPELKRAYQEALQAYVYGAQARIEELQVQVISDEEEVKVDDSILSESTIIKEELIEMTEQTLFDLNIIIQQEHPSLMI